MAYSKTTRRNRPPDVLPDGTETYDQKKYVHQWRALASFCIRLAPNFKLHSFDPDITLRSATGDFRLFSRDVALAVKKLFEQCNTSYYTGYDKGYEDGQARIRRREAVKRVKRITGR